MQKSLTIFSRSFIYLPAILFFLMLQTQSFSASAQDAYSISKARITRTLKMRFIDKAFTQDIDRFYSTTCDSLLKKKLQVDGKPIKDILVKLFDVCNDKINARAVNLLRVPSLNQDFISTLRTYNQASIINLYRNINITKSTMLQLVFDGSLLGDSIKTINGLREMLGDPYYISSNIKSTQYDVYRDTLLYTLANGAPDLLLKKLAAPDTFYTRLVNSSNSTTVKAIVQIKMDEFYDQALPFSLALYEGRISMDSIKKLTLVPQE